jgi:hypothetical protein
MNKARIWAIVTAGLAGGLLTAQAVITASSAVRILVSCLGGACAGASLYLAGIPRRP